MAVEFDTGFFQGELPFHRCLGRIPLGHASGEVGGEFLQGGDALVQALAGDGREFKLDHVEPGGILGGVMDLETGRQRAGLGRGQVLVEDGVGVGVEVVLDEHDFLGLGVVGGQALQETAVVGSGAAGRDLDQTLARARLKSGQQAGRALPPVPAQPAVGDQPAKAGRPRRESSTYVRQGTACLLAAFEPGTGQRLVEVSARRTGADYTRFMQQLAAAYPQAEKIVLVQDNLNTHTDAVFYQQLPAAQARVLAARFEVHYTPKNASWLNMVELELSAIARQCLHQRIPTQDELIAHVAACVAERNAARATVRWQFTLAKARVKLDRHYQKIRVTDSPD